MQVIKEVRSIPLPPVDRLNEGVYEGAESLADGRTGHQVVVREPP